MTKANITVTRIPFRETQLIFEASNDAVRWRSESFYTKEPDTIAWISQFKKEEVLLDIGANVGLYTVLAAKGVGAQVVAFEPESQNFALLNRNIHYNQIQDNCVAYCMALTDEDKIDRLYLSEVGLGGSCHTFGENLDFHLQQRPTHNTQGCVSFCLDTLVEKGIVPEPDHIKIDVDGLEHLVLKGALQTLANSKLKSLLVEINTQLSDHNEVLDLLAQLGFVYDKDQVEMAIRKEGAFKGIGNFIFYKPDAGIHFDGLSAKDDSLNQRSQTPDQVAPSSDSIPKGIKRPARFTIGPSAQATQSLSPFEHVKRCYESMVIRQQPYPHFTAENLFPEDYYALMMKMKPTDDELISINETGRVFGNYDSRFVMHLETGLEKVVSEEKRRFWEDFRQWFCSEALMVTLIKRFQEILISQGINNLNVFPEAMLMRDKQGYAIGPHTDSPARLLTMMVYLPNDWNHLHLGTSVFESKEKTFRCNGDLHHCREDFNIVSTAKYQPNSLFGFLKTNNSFHGFDQMQEHYDRDTMVYIVKHKAG